MLCIIRRVIRVNNFLEGPSRPAWTFFVTALVVRVAGVLLAFENRAYFADESMYLRIAYAVADGHWLGEGTIAAPGLYYFLAALKLAGLDPAGFRIVQSVAGAAAVSIIFLLARRLFGPLTAGLSALILCFYPYMIFLAGVFYPQGHLLFLLALTFLAAQRFIDTDRLRWVALAGALLGLSGLFVVPILSASPIVALWVLLNARGRFIRRAAGVTVMAVMALATILPWTVRNHHVTGRFIFISAMGPSAFYWANNARTDPYMRDAERWLQLYQEEANRERARQGMDVTEMDRHLQFRADRFVTLHPDRAFRNYLTRLGMFFDAAPRSYTANAHTRSRKTEILAVVTSVPVLLLFPVGVWFRRRSFRRWFPLLLVPLAQALAYAAFHVSVRYRLPFEPYFVILAAAGVIGLLGIGEKTRSPGEASAAQP